MSIVTDRRCDGCGEIRQGGDDMWLALVPPGWDSTDHRLDFCNRDCLRKWLKTLAALNWARERGVA